MTKFSVGLGITSLCNMHCDFCYSKEERDGLDVPLDTWKNFFDMNADKISDINFGTGENPLANEWFDLIHHIREEFPHITQALTTNGSLISRMNLVEGRKDLVSNSIDEIDVSIDFGDERHNEFRGHKRAYQMALDTLAFCKEEQIRPTIVMLGAEENLAIENVLNIFGIAKEYSALVRINPYRPVNVTRLQPPTLPQLLHVLDWVAEHHEICSLSDPLISAICTEESRPDPSSISSLRILPTGHIYPSTYLISPNFKSGHITDPNVLDTIPSTPVFSEMRESSVPDDCNLCEVVSACQGGTKDRRLLWYGTLSEKDPYCPDRLGLPKKLRSYTINNQDFTSVHDGYLPTLFFRPK